MSASSQDCARNDDQNRTLNIKSVACNIMRSRKVTYDGKAPFPTPSIGEYRESQSPKSSTSLEHTISSGEQISAIWQGSKLEVFDERRLAYV